MLGEQLKFGPDEAVGERVVKAVANGAHRSEQAQTRDYGGRTPTKCTGLRAVVSIGEGLAFGAWPRHRAICTAVPRAAKSPRYAITSVADVDIIVDGTGANLVTCDE